MTVVEDLLRLSHEIGREDRGLTLLGEGNTSAKLSDDRFLVKASGTCLGTLGPDDVVECRASVILPLLDRHAMNDDEIDAALLAARVDTSAKKPSIESIFHAWALSLPDIKFAGHCHATYVNQILCSPKAREFAENRIIAEEIVCCGVASVYIPLVDPGLKLAQAIRDETAAFEQKHRCLPKVILMQNHGIIAIGPTSQSVLAAIMTAEKAARIFMGAMQLGGPTYLSRETIARVAARPDELYRQRMLTN